MKIIIVGAGEVGTYLTKLLDQGKHTIILIDQDSEKLANAEDEFGIVTVCGDSTSYKVLKEAGAETADVVLSVSSSEPANILTSILCKKFGCRFSIARINNIEFLLDKESFNLGLLGIDDLVSPGSLAAREVKHILQEPVFTEVFSLEDGDLKIMGIKMNPDSPVVGKTIYEARYLNPGNQFLILAIHRRGKAIIPKGNTVLHAGDLLYFIAPDISKEDVLEYCGEKPVSIKKILVLGASGAGVRIAQRLNKYYEIKLIEKDIIKCNDLALSISKVQIVNGDGTDVRLLEEENIGDYDAFIAVTGNSETNIFSCLVAKDLGVKKTIAMVENIGLFDHSQNIGIDTLINKKLATANFIFRKIQPGAFHSFLYGIDAEVLEFGISRDSKLTRKELKDINFPNDAIICAVYRGENPIIPTGTFRFQVGDRVIVLTLPHELSNVEYFFN